MKILAKILGSVSILIIVIAIAVPLLIDVDKYRPQIVELAQRHVSGNLELGKLSLSLWGRIKIQIAKLRISDFSDSEVLGVDDAYIHVPIISLLRLKPVLNLRMQGAEIHLVKDAAGILNVTKLFKPKQNKAADTPQNSTSGEKSTTPSFVQQARLGIEFLDAEVTYKDLKSDLSTQVKDFNLSVSDLSLDHPAELNLWGHLDVQSGKDMTIKGPMRVEGQVQPILKEGQFDHAEINLHATLDDLDMAFSSMKQELKIRGKIEIATDEIKKFVFNIKTQGSDLNIEGRLQSFSKPKIEISASSSELDLNYFLGEEKKETESSEKPSDKTTSGVSVSTVAEDLDKKLDSLRQNPLMQNLVANLNLDFKRVLIRKLNLTDLSCQMQFKDLSFDMKACNLSIFSGRVQSEFHANLKPARPTYQFQLQVKDLEVKEALASEFTLFKNSVLGQFNFSLNGQGASFNTPQAMNNLQAKGKILIKEASFRTIDVGNMVSTTINSSLQKAAEKLPLLKGKGIKLASYSSEFESMTSDFAIDGNQFQAPNFFAKAKANRGVDIMGNTQIGLKDESLQASWEVQDTYNLTGLRDVALDVAGKRVEHVLVEADKPLRLPIKVACHLKKPCFDSAELPSYFAKVATNNLRNVAREELKKETKKVEDEIKKQASTLKDSLEERAKSFFGK